MSLEGDWQRAELARSVTLAILRWPNNQLQRTVLRAAAEPERSATARPARIRRTGREMTFRSRTVIDTA